MGVDFAVILAAVAVFAALCGFLVRRLLAYDQSRQLVTADDEMLSRAVDAAGVSGFLGIGRRRRALKVREELPDALDMIANSLSAGLTLPQALLRNLDHFSPLVQAEFARVIYDTRLGYSIADAFANFSKRIGLKDAEMIAIASRIGVEHGGNIAESYRMLSALLRDNIAFEMELRAMTTEGRMQALVMSCLPFVLLLILSFVSWDLVGAMFTTVAGWCTLAGLCVMLGVAYVWIRKIVDIEV